MWTKKILLPHVNCAYWNIFKNWRFSVMFRDRSYSPQLKCNCCCDETTGLVPAELSAGHHNFLLLLLDQTEQSSSLYLYLLSLYRVGKRNQLDLSSLISANLEMWFLLHRSTGCFEMYSLCIFRKGKKSIQEMASWPTCYKRKGRHLE